MINVGLQYDSGVSPPGTESAQDSGDVPIVDVPVSGGGVPTGGSYTDPGSYGGYFGGISYLGGGSPYGGSAPPSASVGYTQPPASSPYYGAIASMLLQPPTPQQITATPLQTFNGVNAIQPMQLPTMAPPPQAQTAQAPLSFFNGAGLTPLAPVQERQMQISVPTTSEAGQRLNPNAPGIVPHPNSPGGMLQGQVSAAQPGENIQRGSNVPLDIANAPSANPMARFGDNNVVAQGVPQQGPQGMAAGPAGTLSDATPGVGAVSMPTGPLQTQDMPSLPDLINQANQSSPSKPIAPPLPSPKPPPMYPNVDPKTPPLNMGQSSLQQMDPVAFIAGIKGQTNQEVNDAWNTKYGPFMDKLHQQQHNTADLIRQSQDRIANWNNDDWLKGQALAQARIQHVPGPQASMTYGPNGTPVPPPPRGFLSKVADVAGGALKAYNTLDRGGQLQLPGQALEDRFNANYQRFLAARPTAIANEQKAMGALVGQKEKLDNTELKAITDFHNEADKIAARNLALANGALSVMTENHAFDKNQKDALIKQMEQESKAADSQSNRIKALAEAFKNNRMSSTDPRVNPELAKAGIEARSRENVAKTLASSREAVADKNVGVKTYGIDTRAKTASQDVANRKAFADSARANSLNKTAEALESSGNADAAKILRSQAAALLNGQSASAQMVAPTNESLAKMSPEQQKSAVQAYKDKASSEEWDAFVKQHMKK